MPWVQRLKCFQLCYGISSLAPKENPRDWFAGRQTGYQDSPGLSLRLLGASRIADWRVFKRKLSVYTRTYRTRQEVLKSKTSDLTMILGREELNGDRATTQMP